MTHRFARSNALRLAALATGLVATGASAHHGWSWYTTDNFTLTGVVVETHLGNPHDRLTVDADGQLWNVVMSPPSRSRRAGFDESVVEVGDSVTMTGKRHADANVYEMKTARIQVEGQTYDLYPTRL
ncbi:MAG TPA: DUF6152 family protein [Gammaproteobacteria bacterium]|jgi:hypothetical protein